MMRADNMKKTGSLKTVRVDVRFAMTKIPVEFCADLKPHGADDRIIRVVLKDKLNHYLDS